MDIMLGNDAEGFDLLLMPTGDLKLTATSQERLVNAMKIALFTHKNWSGSDLLASSFGSGFEQILALPVNEKNRTNLEKELTTQLQFLTQEKLAKDCKIEVLIIDNRRYSLRISLDNQVMNLDDWLEVRE